MIHERHGAWLVERGIDLGVAERMGLHSVNSDGAAWLVVPYLEQGERVNRKYRMTGEKRHKMDSGAPLCLWNSDCLALPEVLDGSAPLIITEGEFDAIAAIQSGLLSTVSVPNGAPADRTDQPENATRYLWVHRHLAALDRVRTFVIATDGDGPGLALASDLVALLGADRCRFVLYPDGCKDLNDVLLIHGEQMVREVIEVAKPYPISGLFSIDDFPPEREMEAWPVGIAPLVEHLYVVPGTLTVFTGYANIGKSTVLSAIMARQIMDGRGVCVAPFETDITILRESLRQSIVGCGKHEFLSRRTDVTRADAMIRERLSIIYQAVDEDDEMDLDRFMELCRVAVVRDGVRMIVLDPWNELEHKRRRDETETEYTNRALRMMRRFADRYQVAFWVVAHPAKPMPGTNAVPKGYAISGSAAWANKPHYGLTYHRRDPSANEAELHVWKIKQGLPGRKTDKDGIPVTLDFRSWEFVQGMAV